MTETEKRGLSALAPLAGVSLPPSGLTPGGGKMGRLIAQANIQLELSDLTRKICPNGQKNLLSFFRSLDNPMWMWPPYAHC